MASGTAPVATDPDDRETLVAYDKFIDAQIRKTRGQVRLVDVTGELMLLAAGALAFFLTTAVLDHWVLSGGLGFWGRLLLFIAGIGAGGYYFIRRVLPLILNPINPLYAAQAIERGQPSLKNNLINFLFFRARPSDLSANVYHAVEEQAAQGLALAPIESTLDRSKLIKLGYTLLALIVAVAIYKIASPKDPFQTFRRVLMPWSDIQPPTRVEIAEIEPGDVTVPRGKPVQVFAHLRGLPADAEAWVLYTTVDGQRSDFKVPLSIPQGDYRHTAELPPGGAGAQQAFEYRIQAGDATSRAYKVDVISAPTIVVESIDYDYPAYTGLQKHTAPRLGDIKALEGTKVTVHALSNQEIGSAEVVFDPRSRLNMKSNGTSAAATWTLALRQDRRSPEHDGYELRYKNHAGQESAAQARYAIEVTPDLSPSVEFVSPQRAQLDVPLDRSVPLELSASDPDFGLTRVTLLAAVDGREVVKKVLLDKAWRGPFAGKFAFNPQKLGLKAGDVVKYWAEVEDVREPQANRAVSDRRELRIAAAGEPSNHPEDLNPPAGQRRDDGGNPQGDEKNEGADQRQEKQEQGASEAKQQPKPGDETKGDGAAGERRDQADGEDQAAKPDDQPKDGDPAKPEDQKGGSRPQGDRQNGSPDGADNQSDDPNAGDGDQKKQDDQKGGAKPEPKDAKNPVANDGSQDGEAFNRILNKEQPKDEQPKPDQSDKESQPNQQPDQQAGGEKQQKEKGEDQKDQQGGQKSGSEKENQPGGESSPSDPRQNKKPDEKQQKPDSKNSPKEQGNQAGGGGQGASSSNDPGKQDNPASGSPQPSPGASGKQPSEKKDGDQNSSGDSQGEGAEGQPTANKDQGKSDAKRDGEGQGDKPGDPASKDGQQKPPKQGDNKGGQESGGIATQQNADKPNSEGNPKGNGAQPDKKNAGDKPIDNAGGTNDTSDAGDHKSVSAHTQAGAEDDKQLDKKQDAQGQPKKADGKKPPAEKKTDGENNFATDPDQQGKGPKPEGKKGDSSTNKGGSEKEQTPRGNSGAGAPDAKPNAAPKPDGANPPRDKKDKPSDANRETSKEEAQGSANKESHESDSSGESNGDRSGGGSKGGGQRANQRGAGASGQNTASDEGAGQSTQPGQGESTNKPGENKTDQATGNHGDEKGAGPAASNDPGKEPGGNQTGDTQGGETPGAEPQNQGDSASPSGAPTGTGQRGPGPPSGSAKQSRPADPKESAANLDYARKSTDLVLEKLKDQLANDKVDPELLKSLGWTRDDLKKFIARWDAMRAAAKNGGQQGAAANKELDQALKSLGLRPRASSLSGGGSDDQSHGVKESRRSEPPADYREQFKAYTQGAARDKK